jgi:hypothetical protein
MLKNQMDELRYEMNVLNKVTIFGILVIMLVGIFTPVDIANFAFATKNPQAQCVNDQNQGFIGKEQSGDAYKFSKDSCQQLSK